MKSIQKLFLALIFSLSIAQAQQFDIQGHRGCRGVMPENTLPAFWEAVKVGVTTVELDVVISKDGQVVVSHEPWLNATICTGPNGEEIKEGQEKEYNLYEMDYAEIAKCDCGSRPHPRFPDQQKMVVEKPLLKDLLTELEYRTSKDSYAPVWYNIEIKSSEKNEGVFHPEVKAFAQKVYNVLQEADVLDRAYIQSFDPRPLQYLNEKTDIQLSLLVANGRGFKGNMKKLGFTPEFYSPYYKLVSKKLIRKAHKKGVKVVPWTVNDTDKMEKLMEKGVDGIITDYPKVLVDLLKK